MDIRAKVEMEIDGRSVTNRQLEVLKAVHKEGSMTAAAKALGISPPVVYKYLSNIEEAAGSEITRSTPAGTVLTDAGKRILHKYDVLSMRCLDEHRFTVCCSPVMEDVMTSALSSLNMTDVQLVISDDSHNLRMMQEEFADLAIIDDPMYLFDVDEFEACEVGYIGMVLVDNGNSFIRYRYGAQRVAFMFLDTMKRKYTVEKETYSLTELLGSDKSFFVDELMLIRKGIRLKSAIDPKVLRHAVTAVYREDGKQVQKLLKVLQTKCSY